MTRFQTNFLTSKLHSKMTERSFLIGLFLQKEWKGKRTFYGKSARRIAAQMCRKKWQKEIFLHFHLALLSEIFPKNGRKIRLSCRKSAREHAGFTVKMREGLQSKCAEKIFKRKLFCAFLPHFRAKKSSAECEKKLQGKTFLWVFPCVFSHKMRKKLQQGNFLEAFFLRVFTRKISQRESFSCKKSFISGMLSIKSKAFL